jgi:hypothetical protein
VRRDAGGEREQPISVAVSKPSPNSTPSGYIFQARVDPAADPLEQEAR